MAKRKAGEGMPVLPIVQEAVVLLRPVAGEKKPMPDSTRRMAEDVLRQAEVQSGIAPEQVNIMDQMHSFAVRAQSKYIDALSGLRQVERVITDKDPSLALISPVRKRSIRLPE